ncbi:MAG: FAD-dependent oxidoreductase [Alteromonas sp.]|nr:FAD-dependent oxidoreductase [Alteromonas sp.]MAY23750.1 FAD-dependent oxidoreductase [Flavobacteriaceae bacterium]|tara:strand:- start:35939 stop:37072 length:1134 start_codon:yes stop_codon:yes gene_type:complete
MNQLSYWEQQTWLSEVDFAIIGSGIVGLSCALSLRENHPNAKIVVLEKGTLPSGASTKNAGFACFGSVSEIRDDLKSHSEAEVIQLLKNRFEGLRWLRNTLGDKNIDYQEWGGYEVFAENDTELFEECVSNLEYVNNLIKEALFTKNDPFSIKNDPFSFKNIQKQLIFNQFEGQIDTGKMMQALLQKCQKKGVFILNSVKIDSFSAKNDQILLNFANFLQFSAKKLFIATNGFAKELLPEINLQPARAQVLITKPIQNLPIKGTFHLDRGYYYFRNIHDRILLGGGRNLDFEGETTTQLETTEVIQKELHRILSEMILPNTSFEIEHQWSGIMGVGNQKKPIIKKVSENVYCAVRLGGMGVALGGFVGTSLANCVNS